MTYRATMETGSRVAGADGQGFPPRLPQALPGRSGADAHSDVFALKLRLEQLENENVALKIQVNQLIMTLSKTLLRGAVKP